MKVPSDDEINTGLDFILKHFATLSFPRKISTKTTEGRQILVNNRAEALARFKQSNYLDCRISAYSDHDITNDPNFLFIDIDSTNHQLIDKALKGRFQSIEAHPTVLFTGSGYHIYQPIKSVNIDKLGDFSKHTTEPSRQFLRFAEKYLSDNKFDPNHNPSFKSCMVRIPNSINSKNNLQVKIIQEWDGQTPDIILLLGSFYAWILTEEMKLQKFLRKFEQNSNSVQSEIKWIEKILKTPLDDYRKTITNLVLAPYLVNIRQLPFEESSSIIENWLLECRTERQLDFHPKQLASKALTTARKSGYKPMSLNTLKQRNSTVYQKVGFGLG